MTRGGLRRLPGLVVLAALGAGCGRGKQEASSLVAAVERFHQAENVEKADRADRVAEVPCTAKDVCEAKALCVAATDPTARALRLKAEVEKGLGDLGAKRLSPGDEAAKALPGKLDEASRLLEEGHKALPGCDAKLLELRRGYGL